MLQHFPISVAVAMNASGRLVAQRCWPSGLTEEPSIGAHLTTSSDRYTHHGIYVGHGNVIHYAGLSRSWHAGPVEEVNVIEFAFGHPLHIVDHAHARYSAQQIVQRARSRLGERDYHARLGGRTFKDAVVSPISHKHTLQRPNGHLLAERAVECNIVCVL